MTKKNIEISIIIVNWNSDFLLKNCLDSIFQSDLSNDKYEVIVVDNNSKDFSMQCFNNFNFNKKQILNNKNNGFAKACNQGIEISNGEYILFLNPDTEIMENTLSLSLDFMKNNSDVGVMGCMHRNRKSKILHSCSNYPKLSSNLFKIVGLSNIFPSIFNSPTLMLGWDHKTSRCVDNVMGAFYLTKKSILDKVELFDEQFYVYYEDLDLSKRIKNIGYKIFYNSEIEIYHKGCGTSENVKAKRLAYSLHSRILYSKKHFSFFRYLTLLFLTLLIEPFTRIFLQIIHFNFIGISETILGYIILINRLFDKKVNEK